MTKKKAKPKKKRTPKKDFAQTAMAAGLSDHVWKIDELIALIDAN